MTKNPTTPNGLDQSSLEDIVLAVVAKRWGERNAFPSENLGVVAVEREDFRLESRWQEMASEIARETGVGVLAVRNCEWTFPDRCDEDATVIVFDLPSVPESYRDAYDNMIVPVRPETAPSQDDFERLYKAREILKNRIDELRGRVRTLEAAGRSAADASSELDRAVAMGDDITANDRTAVTALLDLDYAAAETAMAPNRRYAAMINDMARRIHADERSRMPAGADRALDRDWDDLPWAVRKRYLDRCEAVASEYLPSEDAGSTPAP